MKNSSADLFHNSWAFRQILMLVTQQSKKMKIDFHANSQKLPEITTYFASLLSKINCN